MRRRTYVPDAFYVNVTSPIAHATKTHSYASLHGGTRGAVVLELGIHDALG